MLQLATPSWLYLSCCESVEMAASVIPWKVVEVAAVDTACGSPIPRKPLLGRVPSSVTIMEAYIVCGSLVGTIAMACPDVKLPLIGMEKRPCESVRPEPMMFKDR